MLNKIVATASALSVGVSAISQIEVNMFLQEMKLMQTQQPVEVYTSFN